MATSQLNPKPNFNEGKGVFLQPDTGNRLMVFCVWFWKQMRLDPKCRWRGSDFNCDNCLDCMTPGDFTRTCPTEVT